MLIIASVLQLQNRPLWLILETSTSHCAIFLPIRSLVLHIGFEFAHLPGEVGDFHLLVGRVHHPEGFIIVVQERKQPVVIRLTERVIFVRMALGALNRQTQDAFPDGIHAVEHRIHAELLGVDAAFFIQHRSCAKNPVATI